MSANRVVVIPNVGRNPDTSSLRLAQTDERGEGRLQRLADLASRVMREARALASEKAFSDESPKLSSLDLASGIDFYGEVARFETALIKLALEQTEGNQARAARLLGLRATTLNSKIKGYKIEF